MNPNCKNLPNYSLYLILLLAKITVTIVPFAFFCKCYSTFITHLKVLTIFCMHTHTHTHTHTHQHTHSCVNPCGRTLWNDCYSTCTHNTWRKKFCLVCYVVAVVVVVIYVVLCWCSCWWCFSTLLLERNKLANFYTVAH